MPSPAMNENRQWQAVCSRDAACDGLFCYGVTSTGIYCRPSCASRQPLRRNVRFFATPAAAEAAGFRACKRCQPQRPSVDAQRVERVTALCRYIETHAQDTLDLAVLARQVHRSPFHLQREFKAVMGLSPKQYLDACRLRALRAGLREGQAISTAIHGAGFGSNSRVYERSAGNIGMSPQQYRAGGAGIEISYLSAATSLGLMMLGATDRGLCFVQFGDDEDALLAMLREEFPAAQLQPAAEVQGESFQAWMHALETHLADARTAPQLPLDIRGTAFQMKVWRYLQQIPAGSVQSYSEVAAAIDAPRAVRAVASACARNRIALLIPCHRVIRGDGSLGGYKWGLARKRALLDAERAAR